MERISERNNQTSSFCDCLYKYSATTAAACTCSAEMAIRAVCPHVNIFSFGYPDVDTVINPCCNQHENNKFTMKYEGKHKEGGGFWWDDVKVDDLSLEELEKFKASLEEVKNTVFNKAIKVFTSTDTVLDKDYVKKLLRYLQNVYSPQKFSRSGVD